LEAAARLGAAEVVKALCVKARLLDSKDFAWRVFLLPPPMTVSYTLTSGDRPAGDINS